MAFLATYEILSSDGRPKSHGLFRSIDELIAHIEDTLDVGIYDVYKELSRDRQGTRNSEYFGEVTKHANGKATYNPVRSASRG